MPNFSRKNFSRQEKTCNNFGNLEIFNNFTAVNKIKYNHSFKKNLAWEKVTKRQNEEKL